MTPEQIPPPPRIKAWPWNGKRISGQWHVAGLGETTDYVRGDLFAAQAAELATLRAERDALPEQLIDILHVLDDEAQTIANRISGMRGFPCQHPDGVQVLEDAETIIRAAFAALKGGA